MNISLKILVCNNLKQWNEFVWNSEQLYTIAHNPCLGQILNQTFGWKQFNVLIYNQKNLIGVFPFCIIGKKLISMPHFSYGGPLMSDNETPPESYGIVFREIIRMINKELSFKIRKIHIRSFMTILPFYHTSKISGFLNLSNYRKEKINSFNSNLRRKIRKAIKNEIEIKSGESRELLNDFFHVYKKSMHRIGSPVLSPGFFENVINMYSFGVAKVFIAYKENKPIGGGICLSYGSFYENCWFSTLKQYNKFYTSYLLHYNMIIDAEKEHCQIYSFGRSTLNSGAYYFKKQWGVENKQLYWNFNYKNYLSITSLKHLHIIWKLLPFKYIKKLNYSLADRIFY